jgi:signal transduction histidine kinase
MKIRSLLLVGNDERFLAVANEAARLAYPEATLKSIPSLGAALQADPADEFELVALGNPTPGEVRLAVQALDGLRLPRWAVVAFGESPEFAGVETLSPPDWEGRLAARAFRSAAAQHLLRRENARFRGDLSSFGIRIAHDLRTPLGCILTSAEALQESLAADPTPDPALLQPIVDSSADLVRLIQQMSLLAKAAAATDHAERFNMGLAVWAATERSESRILRRGAAVSKPGSWPEVTGNQSWLEAVWGYLIDNALRHAGDQPQIELGWAKEAGEFRFWVGDSGPGIAPEKQRSLFQPFHRLHEANAGRGLGLAIVRRLVELQGGRCAYQPRPAGGSIFNFFLPIDDRTSHSGASH